MSYSRRLPIVTFDDYRRVKQVIRKMRHTLRYGFYVNALERKLRRAQIVSSADIPADAITMNTQVQIHVPSANQTKVVWLVYPHFGNERDDCECVLGGLGTALFGSRTGDEIGGPEASRVRIGTILYQPEAFGDFYL